MSRKFNKDKKQLEKERKIWGIATGLGAVFSAQDIVLATRNPDALSIFCMLFTVGLTAFSLYKTNEINNIINNNMKQR